MGYKDTEKSTQICENGTDAGSGNTQKPLSPRLGGEGNTTPAGEYREVAKNKARKKLHDALMQETQELLNEEQTRDAPAEGAQAQETAASPHETPIQAGDEEDDEEMPDAGTPISDSEMEGSAEEAAREKEASEEVEREMKAVEEAERRMKAMEEAAEREKKAEVRRSRIAERARLANILAEEEEVLAATIKKIENIKRSIRKEDAEIKKLDTPVQGQIPARSYLSAAIAGIAAGQGERRKAGRARELRRDKTARGRTERGSGAEPSPKT
ncbi:MAG: uncharacterized protein A8A55_2966 [Amphiamblys sp. WSBS2006]|nr:MAG: uncharacterized protein A8A55_2966 [Amphiamblys sp. WSBS2006]